MRKINYMQELKQFCFVLQMFAIFHKQTQFFMTGHVLTMIAIEHGHP